MKRLAREYHRHPDRATKIPDLARRLGVTVESLDALGVGWSGVQDGRWAIPEHDDQRRVVGVSYRHPGGRRTSAKGGRRGLILPRDLSDAGPLYVCEGMSDTAAMLSAGRCAVGRPAAQCSALVRAWLARLILAPCDGRRVIVVGDRDEAGVAGARDLADWLAGECGRSVRVALPPRGYKDVREQWVASGKITLMMQGGAA